MPGEERLLAGEGLEHPHVVDRNDRQIGGAQDGDDTRQPEGGRRIDPPDSCVRIQAGHDPGMEQTDHRHVSGKSDRSTNLLVRIGPRARDPDAPGCSVRSERHPGLLPRRAGGADPRRLSTIVSRPVKRSILGPSIPARPSRPVNPGPSIPARPSGPGRSISARPGSRAWQTAPRRSTPAGPRVTVRPGTGCSLPGTKRLRGDAAAAFGAAVLSHKHGTGGTGGRSPTPQPWPFDRLRCTT